MLNKPIFVTQPSLSPINELTELLNGIWERGILTHNGPLVQRFECEIESKLKIPHFISVTNGTLAIQMAIKALELKGEIITTPFTWVATLSAIQWEGCTPIFCDIEEDTLNIDPLKIEDKITDNTVAIMPVHVFGNPCNVNEIEKIAKKYNLKIIYDAAHAIGSTINGRSVLEFGDISATSLHATKILNTAEGGGCITMSNYLNDKLKRIRFFGHDENKNIVEEGFNGKLTELHAALGISNLKYFDQVLDDRKTKYLIYKELLKKVNSIEFQSNKFGNSNYSYFPIIFKTEDELLLVEKALNNFQIYPRRYFYPSVNTFEKIVKYTNMPIAESIAKRILCLPLYFSLEIKDIHNITNIIINTLNS
jgi:dTDP-4-amino-4,6-dideoxygalactose transaminase